MTKWWTLPTPQERYEALMASLTPSEQWELRRKAKLRRWWFKRQDCDAA
jgi:hypothetical protein